MERRIATRHTSIPTTHDVVLPCRQTPAFDLEPVVETPPTSERVVAYSISTVPGDRGLERLGPVRISELRGRLESGAYNSPEVLTELAIRLLESGEL